LTRRGRVQHKEGTGGAHAARGGSDATVRGARCKGARRDAGRRRGAGRTRHEAGLVLSGGGARCRDTWHEMGPSYPDGLTF
jgi:hypothetical protein